MQKCPNCSAPLGDDLEQCKFCGSTTDRGAAAKRSREAAQVNDAASARARGLALAQPEIQKAGKWAVLSSSIGTVVCCLLPIGPVLGIVFGLRARRLAQQHGLPYPAQGTLGLALGMLGVTLALFMWVGVAAVSIQEQRHKRALEAQLPPGETLDLKSACALTELELISARYQGFTSLDDFECEKTGDLAIDGRTAVLSDTRFTKGGQRTEVFSCLQLKSRWSVKQVRGDDDCSAAPTSPKATHQ